jgi:hypothetical protein
MVKDGITYAKINESVSIVHDENNDEVILKWGSDRHKITVGESVTIAGATPATATLIAAALRDSIFFLASRNSFRQLFASHTQQANPGNTTNTTENVVAGLAYTIPAYSIIENGRLIIEGIMSWTGTGNHTLRVKIGGVTAFTIVQTTNTSYHFRVQVRNRNSLTAQIVASLNSLPGANDVGVNGSAFLNPAVNFGTDLAVSVTLQNATVGDTSFVEALNITAIG